jgi:hypothetical protein
MLEDRDHAPGKGDPAVTSGRGERSVKVEKARESEQPAKPDDAVPEHKPVHEHKPEHSCCS